jgi:hypothetical protein
MKRHNPITYITRLEDLLPPIIDLTEAQKNEVNALFYFVKLETNTDPFAMGKRLPLPRVARFFYTLMYEGVRKAMQESGLCASMIKVYRKVEGFNETYEAAKEIFKENKQGKLEDILMSRLNNPTEITGGDRLLEFAIKNELNAEEKAQQQALAQVNNIENQVVYNIQVPQILIDSEKERTIDI